MRRYLCLAAAAWALAPPKINLGDYLVQRAVQQQFNYMADLKNEPCGAGVLEKRHRRDVFTPRRLAGSRPSRTTPTSIATRRGASPARTSAAFGQLNKPYAEYLVDLGTAPQKEVVQIEVAPRRRLSARESSRTRLSRPWRFTTK